MRGLFRRQLTRPAQVVWICLGLAYVLLQVGRHQGLVSGWLDWYLADLLCLPILLGGVLVVQRQRYRSSSWPLPRWHGLLFAVVYGAYFELVLPRFKAGIVGDPIDALSYLLGWLLFEILINRPA